MHMHANYIQVQLRCVSYEALDVISFELRPANGILPAFTAGAHIDIQLGNGLIRSYSLVNSQGERNRYVIAVNKDKSSRGGSRFMHETLKVGSFLNISSPRNNFQLTEDASNSVFIAGGVGITPILCMIKRLTELKRKWTLYYCVRSRQNAAFLEEIQDLQETQSGIVNLNFDHGSLTNMLNIQSVVDVAPTGTHFYCCGPTAMLGAFELACARFSQDQVHVEYFAASETPSAEGGFVVELARSKKTIPVHRGMTILDALLKEGIDAPYACMEGVCATCETKVISGIPDHKDLVLTKVEKASNKVMMICCSGSKTEKLVLDL